MSFRKQYTELGYKTLKAHLFLIFIIPSFQVWFLFSTPKIDSWIFQKAPRVLFCSLLRLITIISYIKNYLTVCWPSQCSGPLWALLIAFLVLWCSFQSSNSVLSFETIMSYFYSTPDWRFPCTVRFVTITYFLFIWLPIVKMTLHAGCVWSSFIASPVRTVGYTVISGSCIVLLLWTSMIFPLCIKVLNVTKY